MRLLAVDLAWSGPSGWVDWNSDFDDPVLAYGEFRVSSKASGIEHDQEVAWLLYERLTGFLQKACLPEYRIYGIVYEYTDWHRSLNFSNKKEALKDYAIERRAQKTLGMAVAILAIAATQFGHSLIPLGANEARKEFGATRKDAAARLFAEEYPRFVFEEHKTGFLRDTELDQLVSDHVSDAFVLAAVADRRLRRDELVGRS